jgi:uncharacterized protein YbaP (TraB family)
MARTARRRLLALCLLGSLTLAAVAAHAASPVWAVRGPNNTVYLAGSVHLLPTQDAALPPAFERAYGSAAKGVEEQLVARARADGKPTAGLETLDEELGGLAGLPREEQLRLLDQTLDDLNQSADEMREVVGAWRRGDANQLAALLAREYRSFPALYRQLVTARNQRWLPQIEALLREHADCMVVVGSLHLVGDGGLLELLRKDGYAPAQLN